jgi:bacterioferritin
VRVNGSPAIVEALNEILTAELTTINQYFIHAKMCENWGYERLAEKIRNESIDEMKDADAIIDRILYFDGVPNMQRLGAVRVGESVLEQLELALVTETESIAQYNRAVGLCVAEGDNGTRDLLERQLTGEEEHADWLESQLDLIGQVGLENYLAQQIRD